MKAPLSKKSKSQSRKASGKGAFISKKRIEKIESKIGQANLAKLIGVNPRSIRRYKQGTRVPRIDIAQKIKNVEKSLFGLRKTKSLKLKRERTSKIISERPEVRYYEKRKSFKYSETEHIILSDVKFEDIPELISYLKDEGCEAAFLIECGLIKNKEEYIQTEIMFIDDFEEEWESLYDKLINQYKVKHISIDLVGVMYYAPTPIKR